MLDTSPDARAPVRWQLYGALALVVGGLSCTTAIVSSIGMALGDEAYRGGDVVGAVAYGSLGAAIVWAGWRASRRRGEGGPEDSAPVLTRFAPALMGLGLVLGVVFGVIATSVGLEAARSLDRRACDYFQGPLEPTSLETCWSVARDCRRSDVPLAPPAPRGMSGPVASEIEGLEAPLDIMEPKFRARVMCIYQRRSEFGR